MSLEHVEVLVEEPSMAEVLKALLPRLLGSVTFEIHAHRSKPDLLKKLPSRLQGYRAWLPESTAILVIVDRDADDCLELKARMERMAAEAGFTTRASAGRSRIEVVNRIAIEELEAWYFGDWEAVRTAYPRAPMSVPRRKPYREPDAIVGGTWEAFERVLQAVGYFTNGLRKTEAARAIAEHMDPARNTSPSFRALRETLEAMATP